MSAGPLERALYAVFKVPHQPPAAPAGHVGPARVFRAAPEFLTYQRVLAFIAAAPTSLLLAGTATGLFIHGGAGFVAGGVALLALLALKLAVIWVSTRLSYQLRYYVITDRSLRIRQGLWLQRELTLSFVNVQNVTIEQGPLERLFGISNVVVDTAGGGERVRRKPGETGLHRGELRGVKDAQKMRELIRSALRKSPHHAGLGDAEELHPTSLGRAQVDLLAAIHAEVRTLRERAQERSAAPPK